LVKISRQKMVLSRVFKLQLQGVFDYEVHCNENHAKKRILFFTTTTCIFHVGNYVEREGLLWVLTYNE